MSKRDEDSDMEVGMTTAERRRRRRRGGGLRVPSDNVPRTRPATAPPVVAPVPEDPALAMSIAYSFTTEASEPVPRVEPEPPRRRPPDPVAPEPATTAIDPPGAAEPDFELKTREMSAVDLEALGLTGLGGLGESANTIPMQRISSPNIIDSAPAAAAAPWGADPEKIKTVEVKVERRERVDADVEVTLDSEPVELVDPSAIKTDEQAVLPSADPPKPNTSRRMQTVALSEEDLEEVMESARAASQPRAQSQQVAVQRGSTPHIKPPTQPPPLAGTRSPDSKPPPVASPAPAATPVGTLSAPEIDINELAERAEGSGEIEVDVEETVVANAAPTPPSAPRRPPTVPPAVAPPERRSGQLEPIAHASPPPPPASAVHKSPPTPPPPAASAKKGPPPTAVAAAVVAKEPGKAPPRGKPWFVDLFDEDYLRTLPFLTPQATQAEAEFVLDAMGLAAGAHVLDVGCGYGRHAMELAARGFHVVGLDLSTALLVRGGEEARRRGLTINFVQGDMRELDFENQFDGAYCLFSTFGYFDDETNKKALTNIGKALKPGGKVLVEILNRDYLITDLPTRVWWEGEGCVVLEEVELNYFSSRIQVNRSVVFDDGRQLEQEISVRAYSLHEVGKLMHAAGFRVLEVSGGYQTKGRFFGNQSRHIIVLAERKETPAP